MILTKCIPRIKMQFRLVGTVQSKARPRFYQGRAILPKSYRDWKESAIHALYMQRRNFDESVKPSEVHMIFFGKHNRKNDLDNLSGGILDALVQVGYLKNDSTMYITKLSAELKYSAESPYVLIELI